MQEVTLANFPNWTMYVIAISLVVFAISTALIAFAAMALFGELKTQVAELGKVTDEINKKMPSMMSNVDATVGNVKKMSDDARVTTSNVTGAVDKVSHLAGSVAGRLESPLVKSVGVLSGVLAGARALRGHKKTIVVEKRRGFFGRK